MSLLLPEHLCVRLAIWKIIKIDIQYSREGYLGMSKEDEKEKVQAENTTNDAAEKVAEEQKKEESDKTPQQEQNDAVQDLKQQLDSMNDRYLRLMAEFDNYKKRVNRDYERLVESANEKLMLDLVDVRENFDRAIRSGETGNDYTVLFDGIKLIYNKFESVLSKNGLEVFADIGDVFDPQIHDALMKTPHPTIPEDHISDIYEKGYRLKGNVIKHAKVIVSSGAPQPAAD